MSTRLRRAGGSGESDDHDRRLQVLLSDYEMAREDERTFTNTQGAVLSVAVALLAGIAAFIQSACQFQTPVPDPEGILGALLRGDDSCRQIPDGLLAVTPLAPLAIFAYLQLLASVATVRSYYLRALERQIREEVPGTTLTALPGVPAMAFTELSLELSSLRRGRRAFRLISALLLLSIVIVFLGFSAYVVFALPPVFAVPAALFHGASAVLIGREAIAGTVGGRGLFQQLASSYVQRGAGMALPPVEPVAATQERSLSGYLLLPRPQT